MAQFLALGLEIPEDIPTETDIFRQSERRMDTSDIAVIMLMGRGTFFFSTRTVSRCSDEQERRRIETIIVSTNTTAKEICNAILDYAVKRDGCCAGGHSDEMTTRPCLSSTNVNDMVWFVLEVVHRG